jgi:copper homeostasis protein
MPASKLLEIACFNLESALTAQKSGADRIEFCEDYKNGGVSPSVEKIDKAREKIVIPLHVIIRPRAGNFVYSEMEIQWMMQYILFCQHAGIDGIVFGALTDQKEIDINVCSRLIECAGNMSLTFHRAIDETSDIERSIQQLIDLKIHRVLTSGGRSNVIDGISEIEQLHSKFGKKIIIMPGGGIRSSNINKLLATGCREFHSSAIMEGENADAEEIEMLGNHLKK